MLTMELTIGETNKKCRYFPRTKSEKQKASGTFTVGSAYSAALSAYMMYYTPVSSGWMLSYFFKFATGTFESGMTTGTGRQCIFQI